MCGHRNMPSNAKSNNCLKGEYMNTPTQNYNQLLDLEDKLDIHIQKASKNNNNITSQINTVVQNLNQLSDNVDTLSGTVSAHTNNISTLNTNLGTQTGRIDALTNSMSTKEDATNKTTSLNADSTDTQYPSAKTVYTALNTKQNALNFDDSPTQNSSNPVKSGGVYNALSTKADLANIPTRTSQLQNDSGYLTSHQDLSGYISQGGTLSAPLTVTGGDGANAGKIILTSNGQITNESTATLFGRAGNGSTLLCGHSNYALTMRGSASRPTYNGNNMALASDIPLQDSTPTSGSVNNVSSGGVYSALSGKQNTLTFDNSPTQNSSNPVKSGGVYSALSNKENTSNKVTSISSDSTDTQYPSAKCVYNAIQSAGGGGGSGSGPNMYSVFKNLESSMPIANRTYNQSVCTFTAPAGTPVMIIAHTRIRQTPNVSDESGQVNIYLRINNTNVTSLITEKTKVATEHTLSYVFTATGGTDTLVVRITSVSTSSTASVKSVLTEIIGMNTTITVS